MDWASSRTPHSFLVSDRAGPENKRCLVGKRASSSSLFGKAVGEADAFHVQTVEFKQDIAREVKEADTFFLTLLSAFGTQVVRDHHRN